MLNWIVCNRTIYLYKNEFGIKSMVDMPYNQTKPKYTLYIYIYEGELKSS